MFTHDESNLEKYIDLHIIVPPLSGEKWWTYFGIVLDKVLAKYDGQIDKADKEHLTKVGHILYEQLEPILDTPRKIKSLARHLEHKLSTPVIGLYLVELIILSAIQASNPRLFHWIANNRRKLVAINTVSHEYWGIMGQFREKDEGKRREYVEGQLKEIGISGDEVSLVIELFFGSEFTPPSYGESKVYKRNIRNNQYFCSYFFRNKLPLVGTFQGAKEIERLSKDSNTTVEQIYLVLLKDWTENDRNDLREIILDNIRVWIEEFDIDSAFRLLLALGKLTWRIKDEGFLQHQKSFASFSTWAFLKAKCNERELFIEYINRIINSDVSHRFYTVLIFYLLTEDKKRSERPDFITDDDVKSIANTFSERCATLFYDSPENPVNIFEASDAALDMLYRWAQAQDERLHEKYLLDLIRSKPEVVHQIIQEIRKENQVGVEKMISRGNWKAILDFPPEVVTFVDTEIEFIDNVIAGKHSNGF